MLVAVTTDNVAVMWVAIEATTITSAVLVPLHRSRASVEASWKYILIGSVGIALAFVGTVLAYFDFVTLAGESPAALHWTVLMAAAPRMHAPVVELAFVFLLVGYGTKAGIAPMHTWLPDAHAEAPAPLSAMMSGVLLAVALYAIVRWKAVVGMAGHGAFADRLLIGLGLLSLGLAALSLVGQRHYKRLLAYSSIEHTGLMCVGLALGPLGTFAAMLHLINHSAAKSMMFLLSGRILDRYGTGDLRHVSGLLRAMPITGGLFAAGMVALVGLPPFGLFVSKLALLRAGFATGHAWLMAIVLAFLAVAFVALIGHLNRMLNGTPPAGVAIGERAAAGRSCRSPCACSCSRCSASSSPRRSRRCSTASSRSRADEGSGRALRRTSRGGWTAGSRTRRVVRGRELHCRVEPGRRPGARGGAADGARGRAAADGGQRPARRRGRASRSTASSPIPPRDGSSTRRSGCRRRTRRSRPSHLPSPRIALRARDLRPVRHSRHGPSGSAPAGPARVLAGGLLPAAQGREPRDFQDDGRAFPFTEVGGEGVYEIPVGPVHAGVIEPGHFRFSVVGETIIDMKARLYFTHKGTEKLFEGRAPADGLALAERVSGDTTWATPSPTAGPGSGGRERGAAARALAAGGPARDGAPLQPRRRPRHDRQRYRVRGGALALLPDPRGPAPAEPAPDRQSAAARRDRAGRGGHDLPPVWTCRTGGLGGARTSTRSRALSLRNTLVMDRLEATGRLATAIARDHGVLGYVARASGIDADARRDHPFAAYGELNVRVPVYAGGRREGAHAGAPRGGAGVGAAHPSGAGRACPRARSRRRSARCPLEPAFGLVEGWRGAILHWVMADGDGRLDRVKIVDPSFLNWRPLSLRAAPNIVPDFPLCNKSFNQSYSGNDL